MNAVSGASSPVVLPVGPDQDVACPRVMKRRIPTVSIVSANGERNALLTDPPVTGAMTPGAPRWTDGHTPAAPGRLWRTTLPRATASSWMGYAVVSPALPLNRMALLVSTWMPASLIMESVGRSAIDP